MDNKHATRIEEVTGEPVLDCALDTVRINKQALVFVNTKKSAEKEAEDIARKLGVSEQAAELAEDVKGVLAKPTVQCERLARCMQKGVAFHHAGLHARQKELVEDGFREGKVRIICATPTLAAGVDLPAFRVIIRDVKRYSGFGMSWIPVLEFLQMAGRCGRPKYDAWGEAIVLANTETEQEHVFDKYVQGEPEPVYSKLAVEPVLRTYLLSLVSAGVIGSDETIMDFFGKTFWAHQFADIERLRQNIGKQLDLLVEWGFLVANENGFRATFLGERVAQLYIDPLTAHGLIMAVERSRELRPRSFGLLHVICTALEMRPLLNVRQREYEAVQDKIVQEEARLLQREPGMFESEYDEWLAATKTAMMLEAWIDEKDEEYLLEVFGTRPGETRAKLDKADWLLYSMGELSKIVQQYDLVKDIQRVRVRLKYGVREELLPLVRLEGIGRVRARKLFRNNVRTLAELKRIELDLLAGLLGRKVAVSLKKQIGEKISEEVPVTKRRGQIGLGKFVD